MLPDMVEQREDPSMSDDPFVRDNAVTNLVG